jgi:hypothetical protein
MDTHPDAISDPAVDPTLALSDADEYFESDTEDQSPEPTIADLVRELRQAKLREDALSQRADDDAMERLSLQRALETEKQLSNQLSDDLVNLSKIDRAEVETRHATLLEDQKSAEIKAQRAALLEAQKTAEIEAQRAALLQAQETKHEKHLPTNNSSVTDLSGTSGYNRLHSLGIFSNAATMDVHKAVSLIVNQSDFAETDPLKAAETNASSVAAFIQYQFGTRGCKTFKTACENFEKVFTSTDSDLDRIHSVSSHFMKFLSETLSHISASRCFLLISTRKYIAGTQIDGSEIETSRQVANVIHAYSLTNTVDTVEFDMQCSKQDINGAILEQPLPQNPTDAPGIERLLSQTQSVKFEAWIDIISAVFNYLFADQSVLTREHEESLHSLVTNPSIHMKISKEGVVEPAAEWLSRYNALVVRLKSSAKRLGTPKIEPDDQERIKLAITTSPSELRIKLYSLFETDPRWTSIEFLKRPKNSEELAIPMMKFRDFETVLRTAYANFKRYPTNGITSDSPRDPNSTAGQTPNNTPSKKKSSKGKCSLCGSPDHVAEDCSKRASVTEVCNKNKTGKCRYGKNCKRLHTTDNLTGSNQNPPANALVTGAPAPASLNPSTNSVDTTNWTQCTCQDCQQTHMENADWWNAQTDHTGKPWGLPPRCKKCRAAKRALKALSTSIPETVPPATPAPAVPDMLQIMPPGISLPVQSPAASALPTNPPSIPSAQMISCNPYSSLDNQMDEEDEEDEYEELATCMVVASLQTESDTESNEDSPTQEETPCSRLETARWEKRMKLKHEPRSEVAKLSAQNCTPAAPRRISKPVDRLVLSGSKLLITGSDPILPDEIDAAFNDPDVSRDSIDLSDGDEVALPEDTDPQQHSIKSFFLPAPPKARQPIFELGDDTQQHSIKSFFPPAPPEARQPIIEVEEECLCEPDSIFNKDSTTIQCTRCFKCVKCCRCNETTINKTDLRQYFQHGPARR